MNKNPHKPVLLQEVLDCLSPAKGDNYLDLTAGFGGHALSIANKLGETSKITLVDRDEQAIKYLEKLFDSDKRVKILQEDFLAASLHLQKSGQKYDCILADLGVSSLQIDDQDRGFSYQVDSPLDMRMDKRQPKTATEVLNSYSQAELEQLLQAYGELTRKQATRVGRSIIGRRPITTTHELANAIKAVLRSRKKRLDAQVFQAIRIEVNDELEMLKKTLPVWAELLAPEGRLAVISFHSLEDRIVKQFFTQRSENRYDADFKLLSKKPITSSKDELVYNPRARSAKLRAVVKNKN